MIIERHKLIGHMPIKRRVPKITKIAPSNNGADMDDETALKYYDKDNMTNIIRGNGLLVGTFFKIPLPIIFK